MSERDRASDTRGRRREGKTSRAQIAVGRAGGGGWETRDPTRDTGIAIARRVPHLFLGIRHG